MKRCAVADNWEDMSDHMNFYGDHYETPDHVFGGKATAITFQGYMGGDKYDGIMRSKNVRDVLTQQFVLIATAGSRFDLLMENDAIARDMRDWFGVEAGDQLARQAWHARVLKFLFSAPAPALKQKVDALQAKYNIDWSRTVGLQLRTYIVRALLLARLLRASKHSPHIMLCVLES